MPPKRSEKQNPKPKGRVGRPPKVKAKASSNAVSKKKNHSKGHLKIKKVIKAIKAVKETKINKNILSCSNCKESFSSALQFKRHQTVCGVKEKVKTVPKKRAHAERVNDAEVVSKHRKKTDEDITVVDTSAKSKKKNGEKDVLQAFMSNKVQSLLSGAKTHAKQLTLESNKSISAEKEVAISASAMRKNIALSLQKSKSTENVRASRVTRKSGNNAEQSSDVESQNSVMPSTSKTAAKITKKIQQKLSTTPVVEKQNKKVTTTRASRGKPSKATESPTTESVNGSKSSEKEETEVIEIVNEIDKSKKAAEPQLTKSTVAGKSAGSSRTEVTENAFENSSREGVEVEVEVTINGNEESEDMVNDENAVEGNASESSQEKPKRGRKPLPRQSSPVAQVEIQNSQEMASKQHLEDICKEGSSETVDDPTLPEVKTEAAKEEKNVQAKGKIKNIPKQPQVFTCAVCQKRFTRKYHLDRHLRISKCSGLPLPTFPCELCNRVYTRKDNLREHLRSHTGEREHRRKAYECNYCGKAFHGRSLLDIHIRKHTGERPFECDFCPKKFPSSGALSKHRMTHTGERPYTCNECGRSFTLKGTLSRHLRTHTGIRPHACTYCGKKFIQIGGLNAHMFYHTGENGFKCDDCGKVFNRKARLQMHQLYVHIKLKPFVCDHCSKPFTRKEDLMRHSVLHTGEKPYKCPTCDRRFSVKPSLKLHLLTHTKEEPRSCHECGRAFIRKDCLLRHMRKRHRDVFDKILFDEKDEKDASIVNSRVLSEKDLTDNIRELLYLLIDEPTLIGFGWPNKPVDEVLELVIQRCGHSPVSRDNYTYMDRLRENAKLLFTVVIDDNAVKTLLNNQTVDEVILHVLRLAKT
ncbi:zinc finger protein 37-like isoform X1 [Stegodyphus dumicola]|uniref:zinc finger protein 37-like isoform X1 n=1 Tax=Stegodyphus dumicola TaxID=202533 RepID=UPI0015AF7020|nr:zinc finger protein 37-like isoform X1 [Stegodyphus dumicola]